MSQEERSLFGRFKNAVKQEFKEVKKSFNDDVDEALRVTHTTLEGVKNAYTSVEKKVGRDRLWGAGFGAKAGGLFAASKPHPFYVPAIGVGVVLGAAVGFALGPQISKRYNKANKLDAETNDNSAPPPPTL